MITDAALLFVGDTQKFTTVFKPEAFAGKPTRFLDMGAARNIGISDHAHFTVILENAQAGQQFKLMAFEKEDGTGKSVELASITLGEDAKGKYAAATRFNVLPNQRTYQYLGATGTGEGVAIGTLGMPSGAIYYPSGTEFKGSGANPNKQDEAPKPTPTPKPKPTPTPTPTPDPVNP